MKRAILTATAYFVIVFPLAVSWHTVLFKEQYQTFGYFDNEPNFILGLLSVVSQGVILAILFPRYASEMPTRTRAVRFASLAGVFLWSSHVVAFAARQEIAGLPSFLIMETGYLALQFGLFACALVWIHRTP